MSTGVKRYLGRHSAPETESPRHRNRGPIDGDGGHGNGRVFGHDWVTSNPTIPPVVIVPIRCHVAPNQAADFRFSRMILGCRAAIRSNAIAGPSGRRRPCSQFRSVCTLISIARAKSA